MIDENKKNILIVDDEISILESLKILLGMEGYRVQTAENAVSAKMLLDDGVFNLIVSDVKLPDASGLDILKYFKDKNKGFVSFYKYLPVILMTAYSDVKTGIEAIKLGAYDYISKPLDNDEFKLIVKRALDYFSAYEELGRYKASIPVPSRLKGESAPIKAVIEEIGRVSLNFTNMIITGESGTGKELAARMVHDVYSESSMHPEEVPFVPVNLSAIPENLIESELFGYSKGAFTGADAEKSGLVKHADGGILFLDEIGELPLNVQVKLLRLLQEKTFRKLGSNKEEEVRLKVVAATNADVESLIKEGKFRQDLYYRLNAVRIKLPPLREHPEDVPLLTSHFVMKFLGEYRPLSPEAISALVEYDYPGNARELENIIEHACLYCRGPRKTAVESDRRGEIGVECLPEYIFISKDRRSQPILSSAGKTGHNGYAAEVTAIFDAVNRSSNISLQDFIENIEKNIVESRTMSNDSRLEAAKSLGLSVRSLRYILSKKQRQD